MQGTPDLVSFRRMGSITIAAVYFLILVGGIVRASGAGMGCPDWPTCFGQWVPPISEAELPPNYHAIYAERGYADTVFNPLKTWTEYLNRLVGVSIGLLIFGTLLRSWPLRKRDPAIFYAALATFLMVGFQGWLGSAVVASNLKPYMITAHMLMALTIVGTLIFAIMRSQRPFLVQVDSEALPPRFRTVLLAALGLTLSQIAMGTQIREAVDVLSTVAEASGRDQWRESFPVIFYVHRSFSAVILFTNLWLVWTLRRSLGRANLLSRIGTVLAAFIVIAILSGVTLDRLGFPAFVQPLHLLLANLIFGCQLCLFLAYRYARPELRSAGNELGRGVVGR